jgi:hypothetical protein
MIINPTRPRICPRIAVSMSAAPASPKSPNEVRDVARSNIILQIVIHMQCGWLTLTRVRAKLQTAETLVAQIEDGDDKMREIDRQVAMLMVSFSQQYSSLAYRASAWVLASVWLLADTTLHCNGDGRSQEEREVYETQKKRLTAKLARFETFELVVRVRGAVIAGKQEHTLNVYPADTVRHVKEALCISMQKMHRKKHGNEEVLRLMFVCVCVCVCVCVPSPAAPGCNP